MKGACRNLKYFTLAKGKERERDRERDRESYVVKLQHNFNLGAPLLFTYILKPYSFNKLFLKKGR
jgi:hypothetical protein